MITIADLRATIIHFSAFHAAPARQRHISQAASGGPLHFD
jgi:hypothetical protein